MKMGGHMTTEEKLGYLWSANTSFRVRIELAAREPIWLRGARSLDTCQRQYIAARNISDLEPSAFGPGHIFDQEGQLVATIGYDGRLWRPGDYWQLGVGFVAECPPAGSADAA